MSAATSETEAGMLTRRAVALCGELGYDVRTTFYTSLTSFNREENLHVVTAAFDVIRIHAVFGIAEGASVASFKPVVYVGIARNEESALQLHRRVWTQGAVPFLLVVTPTEVQVRNALEPPSAQISSFPYEPGTGLHTGLEPVLAMALTSAIHWRDFSASRDNAIDTRLVNAIEHLNLYVRNQYPDLEKKRGLVNALIGRLLYLYVLVDRRIVGHDWMYSIITRAGCAGAAFASEALHQGARPTDVPFEQNEVWAVLDGIDNLINGSVFPISEDERRILPLDLMHMIHRVVRCADLPEQASFIDVSFEVLRTETISAIYERFLKIEDEAAQRIEGAFYTPPFLADYVVARVDQNNLLGKTSRVLDPAAGSGVFLVSAYRRIMERCVPSGGWGAAHAAVARDLLSDCIFGIEKNPQAVNICRFSLYLTMLEYIGGTGIEELAGIVRDEKLLPRLDQNVLAENAFRAGLFPIGYFTHVVGNPPWAQPSRQRYNRNRGGVDLPRPAPNPDPDRDAFEAELGRDRPIGHGRLSDFFVWLTEKRLLMNGGTLGLILPAKSLVGRQSGKFARAFATTTAIRFVANLSHLRYKLFSGAESPAMVVVAKKEAPGSLDLVNIYRPRLSSLPRGRAGHVWSLLVSQTDVHPVRSRDLRSNTNGWLAATMLSVADRRMREALLTWSSNGNRTFGGFLSRSGLHMQRGGDPGETGVPQHIPPGRTTPLGRFILDKNNFARVNDDYRPLFSAGVVLVPRSFGKAELLDEPQAFRSTFNGIARGDRWKADRLSSQREWDIANTTVSGDDRDALLGIVEFLNSGVAAYFASLFGATFVMDNARLEKGDIAALPCPYESVRDPDLRALVKVSDVDDGILDAMNAGPDLRIAVKDYIRFNKGFANGQLPDTAFNVVSELAIEDFVSRFESELLGNFTKAIRPTILLDRRYRDSIALRVRFASATDGVPLADLMPDGTFVASSVITFDRSTQIGTVTKSLAQFAWMSDQAVADAEALTRLLRAPRS